MNAPENGKSRPEGGSTNTWGRHVFYGMMMMAANESFVIGHH
jgi:hypothetical protein